MRKLSFTILLLLMGAMGISARSPKVVAVLGDSYSTYQNLVSPRTNLVWYHEPKRDNTDVSSPDQTWWRVLTADTTEFKLGKNNSYSGATICSSGYHGEDYSDRAFYARMNDLGTPDIILVFGGTNDSWANSPIGDYKYADWTKADLFNFRPAMAYMLDGMKRLYPEAEVYFLLNSELKPEINESAAEICRHYGVECIALTDIDKQSGHPTVKGMQSIANQVKARIRK